MVKVNFAEVEDFKPLASGKYHFRVTDAEVRQTKEDAKHPDVDFWWLELTVQDGEQQGKTQNLPVMLPPYELYTLVGILRATVGQHKWTDEEVQEGEADVELDDLLDLEFIAKVKPQKGNSDFNQVSNFAPYDEESWADADLLP